jgi:hypothetical protein
MLMQAESFLFSTYDAIAFEKCIDGNQVEKQMHQSENIRFVSLFLCVKAETNATANRIPVTLFVDRTTAVYATRRFSSFISPHKIKFKVIHVLTTERTKTNRKCAEGLAFPDPSGPPKREIQSSE